VGAIHRFEQRLEQMVTGAFARAFRSAVQPLEIAAALQREVDNSAQILSRDRRLAPNDFMIDLSPTDFDRLSTYGDTLSRELAAMLHEHAQEQGYVFTGPVRLNFSKTDDLTTGRFRVRSAASAAVTPAAGQSMTDTAIRRAPMYLEINGVRHPLEPPGLVVGRGSNADLRIDDPGVSRRHVQFRVETDPDGTRVTVMDLGSTNGTLVNGQRIQHAVVGDGAVIVIGGTRLLVGIPAPSSGPSPSRPATTSPGQPPYGGATSQAYPPQQPQPPAAERVVDPRRSPSYRPPRPQPGPGPQPPTGWTQGYAGDEPPAYPGPAPWSERSSTSRSDGNSPSRMAQPPQRGGSERTPWNG
jgi:pSer/pThr/pTyr-binding forkhead associated (FHA) protein